MSAVAALTTICITAPTVSIFVHLCPSYSSYSSIHSQSHFIRITPPYVFLLQLYVTYLLLSITFCNVVALFIDFHFSVVYTRIKGRW